ncbi:MAG TPA: 2-dehydro-3-deoxy-D-gluconate 5-dehydrogenase KduD [Caldilineaceae bacterium]|nr:2-dehydro-3-deoxy-D-gluconate 5-dehydrogenase KduD [Caldilineaceae bacterium]
MNTLNYFDLSGRVALVTGAGRGIGQAMAVALADAGADIACLYNTRYEETATKIRERGRRFLPIQLDLVQATPAAVAAVVQQVVDDFGRLDILVNNAGIIRRTKAVEYSAADWETVLQVNLDSVFYLSQAAGRAMLQQELQQGYRGKIIQVASVLSFQGGILVPAYTAAKHALTGITKALANEWAGQGIGVNAIAPGYITTDNTEALRNDTNRSQAILERIPAGRWGEPEDLAGVTVFLASAASNYVHGATFVVDGGWLAR